MHFRQLIAGIYYLGAFKPTKTHKNGRKWVKIHRMLLKFVLAAQTIEQGPKLLVRRVRVFLALNSYCALVKQYLKGQSNFKRFLSRNENSK